MKLLMCRLLRPRRVALLSSCLLIGAVVPCLSPTWAEGPVSSSRTGFTLAFVDADARHVVDAVLGDMLHANYSVDPKISGTITLRTAEPVDRDDVVQLLEKALEPIGAAVIESGSGYRIVSRDSAHTAALLGAASDRPRPGYSGEVVKLRYANPKEIARLIEEFVSKEVVAGTDPSYNQIILAGSSEERAAALAIVKRFDVDALAGSTFQLIHLENVDADALDAELKAIFQPPLDIIGSRVRIVPLPRLHSILAIASDANDIARIQPWIQRLDLGGATTKRRLFSYAVQNGRARDLASSLQQVLGHGDAMTSAPGQPTQAQATQDPLLDTSSMLGIQGGSSGLGNSSLGSVGATSSTSSGSSFANQTLGQSPTMGAEAAVNGAPLQTGFGSGQGASDNGPRIVPVEATNMLLIYANGEDYDFIRQALAQLDRPVPQIMIEATLAEVTLTKDLQYGVNWQVMSGNSTFTLSNTTSAKPAASFPGFSYGYIGSSVQAVLNNLQATTNVRVLSAPKLMVLNNQTATLQVGDEVPIATQQSQSVSSAGAPVINTIELHDTGVILKVTPRVNESGTVTLDIAQEVSSVAPTTTSGINSPTIQQRRLTSTISTRSGQMVALGGLIREDVSRQRQGIPGLSQIPVIGGLFGQHTTNGDRTELIILLTPVVIRSTEEAHNAADELLSRMGSVRPVLDDAADRSASHAAKH